MNAKKDFLSKISNISQNNSNDTSFESKLNSSQISGNSPSNKTLNKDSKYRNMTPTCSHAKNMKAEKQKNYSTRSNSLLLKNHLHKNINKNVKLNLSKITLTCKRDNSCSKFGQDWKKEIKVQVNCHNSAKRSKTIKPKFSNLFHSFNKILSEIIPVTAKVAGIPKNQNLDLIYQKINVNIDNKTFIFLKYNKKNGNLFIKFRNKYYFNYYYSYFKNRSYFYGLPKIKMTRIEETRGLWDINNKNEQLKELTINNNDVDNSFYHYIRSNFSELH